MPFLPDLQLNHAATECNGVLYNQIKFGGGLAN